MNSVGNVRENIGNELDSVVCSAFILKLFPKTGRKLILFEARKRIQVSDHIYFEHILFFRVYPCVFEFKSILKLFPE